MIILGIDLGKARTGVAVCDRAEMLASPLCVIQEHNRERLIEKIVKLSNERRDCPWLSKSDRCQGEKKKGCGGQRRRGHYFTELFGL